MMRRVLKRFSNATLALLGLALALPALASAHVIVTPAQVGVGKEQLFSVSSPNERQDAIIKLTLTIPDGVTDVTPTAKAGWTITTSHSQSNEENLTAITWSDGQIPVGQRDDFSFAAQVPAKATALAWKSAQTYADGTVVSWNQVPKGSDDSQGNSGPYSETKVVDDVSDSTVSKTDKSGQLALIVACIGLIIGVGAWLRTVKTK